MHLPKYELFTIPGLMNIAIGMFIMYNLLILRTNFLLSVAILFIFQSLFIFIYEELRKKMIKRNKGKK